MAIWRSFHLFFSNDHLHSVLADLASYAFWKDHYRLDVELPPDRELVELPFKLAGSEPTIRDSEYGAVVGLWDMKPGNFFEFYYYLLVAVDERISDDGNDFLIDRYPSLTLAGQRWVYVPDESSYLQLVCRLTLGKECFELSVQAGSTDVSLVFELSHAILKRIGDLLRSHDGVGALRYDDRREDAGLLGVAEDRDRCYDIDYEAYLNSDLEGRDAMLREASRVHFEELLKRRGAETIRNYWPRGSQAGT